MYSGEHRTLPTAYGGRLLNREAHLLLLSAISARKDLRPNNYRCMARRPLYTRATCVPSDQYSLPMTQVWGGNRRFPSSIGAR
jgi:hypothetical protein